MEDEHEACGGEQREEHNFDVLVWTSLFERHHRHHRMRGPRNHVAMKGICETLTS